MKRNILCLPGGMPRSIEYIQSLNHETFDIVGASSEKYDVSQQNYPDWVYIPHISDAHFADALKQIIQQKKITDIFTPHQVIWNVIKELIGSINLPVSLINPQPIQSELNCYQQSLNTAQTNFSTHHSIASDNKPQDKLTTIELASLIKHVRSIPGESDEEKIAAISEIFRFCPTGDIVEIGVLWGKSAFVFAYLAKKYAIGSVLCIDPWDKQFLPQGSQLLTKYSSNTHDISQALSVFQMNLLPYSNGHINYIQSPSIDAFKRYHSTPTIETAEFGLTQYQGKIALLHIDGNHAYDFVHQDLNTWHQKVCPNGWVIMDDYCWKFGDGPKRTTDDFIEQNKQYIQCAFIMGGALFFQFKGNRNF